MNCSSTISVINYGYINPKTGEKYGDTRIVRKFLWFPKYIGNECKWLVNAQIEERYEVGLSAFRDLFGSGYVLYKWVEKRFI